MADTTDTNAAIWKSESVARTFAAQSAEREQQRREQLTLVGRLLPFAPDGTFTFVDLGEGTGAASRAVLAEYPNAHAILAEFSPQMANEGKKAMSAFEGRYRYVEFDMLQADWSLLGSEPLDAVISALSVHHIPDDRKRSLFGEILAHLRPGAWYINYDPVKAPDDTLESIWERVNDRYDPEAPHKRAHMTDEEQARHATHVRYMIPLQPQLQWLRDAGFENVDVFWKRLDWVIYGGSKPAA